MGDCASWIKNFPKSHWFNFSSDTKVMFSMDGFHFSQALNNLTTTKYPEIKDALQQLVKENNKENLEADDIKLILQEKEKCTL